MFFDSIKILISSPKDFLNLVIRSLKSKYFKMFLRINHDDIDGRSCNICKQRYIKFMSDKWHKNIICPNCFSDVRHRLFFELLNELKLIDYDYESNNILHFAPEKIIYNFLKNSIKKGSYLTADISGKADVELDICNMKTIKDKSISCLLAIDVLEHIISLENAMKETYRVLNDDGIAIFSFPTIDGILNTIDNNDKKLSKKERMLLFGQIDHNRLIGEDIVEKFRELNFKTNVYEHSYFSQKKVMSYSLKPDKPSLRKFATNNRKIFVLRKII